jgi:hypothetical protein
VSSRRPTRQSTEARQAPLHQLADHTASDADYVLLSCFGAALTDTRSRRELCLALHQAGYHGALAGHMVSNSPLLVTVSASHLGRQRYRLRPCTE